MKQTDISPDRWYSLSDITAAKLFPFCKDIRTVKRRVDADRDSDNILQAVIMGEGRNTRYHIKGANIIKYRDAIMNRKASITA